MLEYLFVGIIVIPFLIILTVLFRLKKKYYDTAFKYSKISKRKFEHIYEIPWHPSGLWFVWSREKRLKYFSEDGVRLLDRYFAKAWMYGSFYGIAHFIIIYLFFTIINTFS
jgi:hypothetical protein